MLYWYSLTCRKILNDLSSTDTPGVARIDEEPTEEESPSTITLAGTAGLHGFPTGKRQGTYYPPGYYTTPYFGRDWVTWRCLFSDRLTSTWLETGDNCWDCCGRVHSHISKLLLPTWIGTQPHILGVTGEHEVSVLDRLRYTRLETEIIAETVL